VAGERRWRAAQQARLHDIPVIIRELSDEETMEIALIENLQRKDLNAIEEATTYQRLMNEFDLSQEHISERVGKSRSYIANSVRLLGLPPGVKSLVVKGDLTAGHARALLASENPALLAAEVIKQGLNVRQTEKLAADSTGREIKSKTNAVGKAVNKGMAKDHDTVALERKVSELLGLKVTLDQVSGKEGSLVIEYKSLEQLDDVLKRLAQKPDPTKSEWIF
jgi:ParB family chromosome partitioning protein